MLSIIVAYDRNHVIGKNNALPWHLPSDLAYFKKVTTGKTIVMGRKTFESIGKPLPNRKNVVLTTNSDFSVNGVEVVHSIEDIINQYLSEEEEVCIIGGETLFKQALPFVQKLYITLIDDEFAGDTYFPKVNFEDWTLTSKVAGERNEKNPYSYYFVTYEKK